MNKNKILCAISLFMLVGGAFIISSCENNVISSDVSEEIHEHIWDDGTVVTEATCIDEGLIEYKCSGCNQTKNEVIESFGHSYSNVIVTNPTCEDNGYTTYLCENCDYSYIDDYVDALGHNEVKDIAINPTCEETGLTEGSHCSECGKVLLEQIIIEAKGHSYETEVIDPTCLNEGFTINACENCDYSYRDNYVDALGHSYESKEVLPTCELEGYTLHSCSRCEDSYKDNMIDALGHKEIPLFGFEATCNRYGATDGSKCSVCDSYIIKSEILSPLGHNYVDGYCTLCNRFEQDPIIEMSRTIFYEGEDAKPYITRFEIWSNALKAHKSRLENCQVIMPETCHNGEAMITLISGRSEIQVPIMYYNQPIEQVGSIKYFGDINGQFEWNSQYGYFETNITLSGWKYVRFEYTDINGIKVLLNQDVANFYGDIMKEGLYGPSWKHTATSRDELKNYFLYTDSEETEKEGKYWLDNVGTHSFHVIFDYTTLSIIVDHID